MSAHTNHQTSAAIEQYEALTSVRSRSLVSILADQPKPLPPAALAVVRAVETHDGDPADLSEQTVREHRIGLEHSDLPRLAASGLVEYDSDGVVATDEGVTAVRTLTDAIPPGMTGEDLLTVLKRDRRRTVVSVLSRTRHETVTLTGLTAAVATAEHDGESGDIDREQRRAVRTSLHHVHLPKLDEAGLVEYDAGRLTVTDTGTDAIDSTWLVEGDPVEPLSTDGGQCVPTSPDAVVWTIDDSESVDERTRALTDHADEELFVVLTVEDLLAPDCLTHLRLATERGVDVTVGSPVGAVRDRVRRAVPEATVTEPQHDWLDTVVDGDERISRLLVADRRAAMLATLDDGSTGTETAITGDGRDNDLVRAVRDLLGPRLDAADGHEPDSQSPARP